MDSKETERVVKALIAFIERVADKGGYATDAEIAALAPVAEALKKY